MRCPKCAAAFESLLFEGVEVDRCTGCGGIWFDATERARLAGFKRAGGIDTGRPRVGKRYNAVRDVACPRCGEKMITEADAEQFHIEFEACPACLGTFFDAGEFRDLSELTIVERLRKVVDDWLSVR